MARLTSEQKYSLFKKISDLYGYAARHDASKAARVKDTPEIAKMRKAVERFDNNSAAREDAIEARYIQAEKDARDLVLFAANAADAFAKVSKLKALK